MLYFYGGQSSIMVPLNRFELLSDLLVSIGEILMCVAYGNSSSRTSPLRTVSSCSRECWLWRCGELRWGASFVPLQPLKARVSVLYMLRELLVVVHVQQRLLAALL